MKFTNKIGNLLFVLLLLAIIFIPSVKAGILQGFMKIGLFRPTIPDKAAAIEASKEDFSYVNFEDITKKQTSLIDLRGKTVFINFWATWCPPCRAEMPSINELANKFKGDSSLVFIMVDADGKLKESTRFVQNKKWNLPVYKMASSVPDAIFSGTLPTTIVINKQGKIVFKEEGAANYATDKFVNFMRGIK